MMGYPPSGYPISSLRKFLLYWDRALGAGGSWQDMRAEGRELDKQN